MEILQKKLSYWYMRYLIVTELFMCEKWERNMFHVIALILLTILGIFNQLLVVGGVRFLRALYLYYTSDLSVATGSPLENMDLTTSEL